MSEKGSKSSKDHLCPVLICDRRARKAGVGVNQAVGPPRGKTVGGKATLGKCSELEKGPAVPGSWGATAVGQVQCRKQNVNRQRRFSDKSAGPRAGQACFRVDEIAEDQTDAGWDEGACGVGKLCGGGKTA